MESPDSNATFTATHDLTRALRQEAEGRERFTSYTKRQYALTARLFIQVGYETIEGIRTTQEQARQYFLPDLRKGNRPRRPLKELRLTMEFSYLWPVQKNEDKPSYEEITIPAKLRGWAPSLQNIKGLLLPDQDECNYFSLEPAKGRCEKPPMVPYIAAELHKSPRMPSQEAHTRALDSWETLQKTHKRPSTVEMGFQAWIAYNLRFILTGDLCGAWDTFGGLSAQLAHQGAVMNLAITENATIAQTYDNKIKTYAQELSNFCQLEKKITELLTHEDQRIKRDTLRDCGAAQAFGRPHKDGGRKGDKDRKVRKGGKGDKYHNWWDTGKNGWDKPKKGWYSSDWNNKENKTDDKNKAADEPSTEKTSEKAMKPKK